MWKVFLAVAGGIVVTAGIVTLVEEKNKEKNRNELLEKMEAYCENNNKILKQLDELRMQIEESIEE